MASLPPSPLQERRNFDSTQPVPANLDYSLTIDGNQPNYQLHPQYAASHHETDFHYQTDAYSNHSYQHRYPPIKSHLRDPATPRDLEQQLGHLEEFQGQFQAGDNVPNDPRYYPQTQPMQDQAHPQGGTFHQHPSHPNHHSQYPHGQYDNANTNHHYSNNQIDTRAQFAYPRYHPDHIHNDQSQNQYYQHNSFQHPEHPHHNDDNQFPTLSVNIPDGHHHEYAQYLQHQHTHHGQHPQDSSDMSFPSGYHPNTNVHLPYQGNQHVQTGNQRQYLHQQTFNPLGEDSANPYSYSYEDEFDCSSFEGQYDDEFDYNENGDEYDDEILDGQYLNDDSLYQHPQQPQGQLDQHYQWGQYHVSKPQYSEHRLEKVGQGQQSAQSDHPNDAGDARIFDDKGEVQFDDNDLTYSNDQHAPAQDGELYDEYNKGLGYGNKIYRDVHHDDGNSTEPHTKEKIQHQRGAHFSDELQRKNQNDPALRTVRLHDLSTVDSYSTELINKQGERNQNRPSSPIRQNLPNSLDPVVVQHVSHQTLYNIGDYHMTGNKQPFAVTLADDEHDDSSEPYGHSDTHDTSRYPNHLASNRWQNQIQMTNSQPTTLNIDQHFQKHYPTLHSPLADQTLVSGPYIVSSRFETSPRVFTSKGENKLKFVDGTQFYDESTHLSEYHDHYSEQLGHPGNFNNNITAASAQLLPGAQFDCYYLDENPLPLTESGQRSRSTNWPMKQENVGTGADSVPLGQQDQNQSDTRAARRTAKHKEYSRKQMKLKNPVSRHFLDQLFAGLPTQSRLTSSQMRTDMLPLNRYHITATLPPSHFRNPFPTPTNLANLDDIDYGYSPHDASSNNNRHKDSKQHTAEANVENGIHPDQNPILEPITALLNFNQLTGMQNPPITGQPDNFGQLLSTLQWPSSISSPTVGLQTLTSTPNESNIDPNTQAQNHSSPIPSKPYLNLQVMSDLTTKQAADQQRNHDTKLSQSANPRGLSDQQQSNNPYINSKTHKKPHKDDSHVPIHALAWSTRKTRPYRVVSATFLPNHRLNYLNLSEFNRFTSSFDTICQTAVPYPVSQIVFAHDSTTTSSGHRELFATASEYVRIYSVDTFSASSSSLVHLATLSHAPVQHYSAPITSLSWTSHNMAMLASGSSDGTISVWNTDSQQLRSNTIAHDGPVYDIEFHNAKSLSNDPASSSSNAASSFANQLLSTGADGKIVMHDFRSPDKITLFHCTTHENESQSFALDICQLTGIRKKCAEKVQCWGKLSLNQQDNNLFAAMSLDLCKTAIFDIRSPNRPAYQLQGHIGSISNIQWSPFSSSYLMTSGTDGKLLLWDFLKLNEFTHANDCIALYHATPPPKNLKYAHNQIKRRRERRIERDNCEELVFDTETSSDDEDKDRYDDETVYYDDHNAQPPKQPLNHKPRSSQESEELSVINKSSSTGNNSSNPLGSTHPRDTTLHLGQQFSSKETTPINYFQWSPHFPNILAYSSAYGIDIIKL